jgi:hypothetical protein
MRLFGWRRKPAVPDSAPVLPDPLERLRMLENELRQTRQQVEFIRTRLSCYVGDGIALTYLADETPVRQCERHRWSPNLLNGGSTKRRTSKPLLVS